MIFGKVSQDSLMDNYPMMSDRGSTAEFQNGPT